MEVDDHQKKTDQIAGENKIEVLKESIAFINKEKEDENKTSVGCLREEVSEDISILDEAEKIKVDEMRALCQKLDSSHDIQDDVDDLTLRRFLRARDMKVENATSMFVKYRKWRRALVPGGGPVLDSQVRNEISQNKFFMQGFDKKGRPIAVLLAARHKKAKVDEFKNFVVYCLEKICSRMPQGREKFVAIGDLQGWGYSNCDIRGYLAALLLMQDYYPERIGKVFIIHAPNIFNAIWKMIYPFIDNNTNKKIVLVENENLKSTLLSEIDESQLPVEYGGKLQLVPIQEC